MVLFVEYYLVIKFLFLSEGAIIIRQWGFGDDATSDVWNILRFGDIPLGSAKVPSLGLLGLVTSGLSDLQRGISFVFQGFHRLYCLMGLKLIPFFCFFAHRIARGNEETYIGQVRHTVSSMFTIMFVEELRLFSQVPNDIKLEVEDGPVASTIGGANNVVYFTREQFAVGLCFLLPSLVKQFLHFIRAPPALVHPNDFWILMGCSVLNLLYWLNI